MQSDSRTRFIPIGLMLFALFFGAGNLIFPASMGQAAGTDVWWALLGFCITGVGLPLLTVMAVGYSGLPGVREIGNRVHPWFGVFYSTVCILAIGPCFAVPRTGTVSWEIAIVPFLEPSQLEVGMPIFLAVFLGVAGWLAASPSKLVDRVGKILTPLLVLTLVVFIIKSFITPMGEPQTPAAPYATPVMAVVQGILDGYNTLDAIAALIFASLTIGVVRDAGFTKQSDIAREVFKAALIAAPMLGVIYIFIAKIGAESVSAIGIQETGAPILALSAKLLFGNGGAMLLAAMDFGLLDDRDRFDQLHGRSLHEFVRRPHQVRRLGCHLYCDFLFHRLVRFEDHHRFDHSGVDVLVPALRGVGDSFVPAQHDRRPSLRVGMDDRLYVRDGAIQRTADGQDCHGRT
jgi:LIVCS family branched-chain amino acid:cation transporter